VIEGVYTLRLRAFDMDGRVGEDRNVIVVNQTAVPVYIRADGSVDPATELVVREGDVYRLTGNIVADGDVIVIQRNNIVLDGAGYSIQGTGRYGAGIQLVGRSNVTVRDIVITGCLYGVFLEQSSDDTVSGCRVEGNTHGIFLYESSNNRIVENKVSSNDYGIALMFFSNNNTLHENCIANHQGRNAGAVWFYCSSNNSLYHNAFMNNYLHVYDAAWDCADAGIIALSRNIWDSDYPSGGNYWGGYADADSWRGPYQNVTGGDRIGDVPFIVDQINRDRYPLLKPYTLDSHDVGVTSIGDVCHETWTPLKTVVGLGFVLRINVFVRNYGSHPEVLNVTIYANATVVSTLSNIAVASRDFLMLGFTWNTTGSAKGSCTISAYVAPVNGEILTDDNTLVGGTVQVGVPCDVSGQTTGVPDGVCNMRDIGHMCAHFGTTPFTPNWDPNCDITGPSSRVPDYAVNMRDIGEACSNFGKT
jgi:parallel beta-helix repeat protein